jgi:hypothetical protein
MKLREIFDKLEKIQNLLPPSKSLITKTEELEVTKDIDKSEFSEENTLINKVKTGSDSDERV